MNVIFESYDAVSHLKRSLGAPQSTFLTQFHLTFDCSQ